MTKLVTGVSTDIEFLEAINEKGAELTANATPKSLADALDSTGGNVSYYSPNEYIIQQVNAEVPSKYIPWLSDTLADTFVVRPNITIDTGGDTAGVIEYIIEHEGGVNCPIYNVTLGEKSSDPVDLDEVGYISIFKGSKYDDTYYLGLHIGGSTSEPTLTYEYEISEDFSTYTLMSGDNNGYYSKYNEETGQYDIIEDLSTSEDNIVRFPNLLFKYEATQSTIVEDSLLSQVLYIEKD